MSKRVEDALVTTGQALAPSGTSPYWQMATSLNTRIAYQADVRHFMASGGLLPTTTEGLLHYLHQSMRV